MMKFKGMFLIYLCLFAGLILLFLGVKNSIELHQKTKDYATTTGYFYDFQMDSDQDYDPVRRKTSAATYFLVYNYTVDNKEYMVTTDYSTSFVPAIGSEKEICYNPENPEDAFIMGPNGNTVLFIVGGMFVVIPGIFLYILLSPNKKKKEKKKKLPVDGFRMFLGGFLILLNYGILYIITGSFSIFSMITYFRTSFMFPMIIPLLLLAAGIFMVVTAFFPDKVAEWNQRQKDISSLKYRNRN